MRSGTICLFSDGHCIDQEGGYTFWNTVPVDNCKFQQYSILYDGLANKVIDHDFDNKQIMYSLSTQDITFALTAKSKETVCGYVVIKTEHPKLLIFETTKGESFANYKKISVTNVDIFAYVNSKFVYVEKHLRSRMKQLYKDVLTQKCKLEKQTLKNSLSIATQSPDEFAFDLMKGPGYMAVVAGEVVHIIKCVPVEIKMEHGESCYAELQVTGNNKTHFLTPRTHILNTQGTEIPCNRILPSQYYVSNKWYKILPLPTTAEKPTIIKPMTAPTWEYVNPSELATNDIYTEQELDQIRERVMLPVERPVVLNDLAREMRGHPLGDNEGSLLKLLNEDVITTIASNTWNKLCTHFITFGTASAGIIAIFMIIHMITVIIDIIIQGYTLHAVYGWSIHLLGALWSSVTYLLIQIARRPTVSNDIKLGEIQTTEQDNSNQEKSTKREKEEKPSNSRPFF